MEPWRALPSDLPHEIAVFPLTGALLLPNGKLPLHIFEPRYKAMIEDALSGARVFGMIQPDGGGSGTEATPSLFGVGCLGRISSFSETPDGDRYLVSLSGVIRFAVQAELAERRGYRQVRADYGRFLADLEPPPERLARQTTMMAALRSYFAAHGFDANWGAIEGMPDDDLVVTLCMVCPFDPREKQALLEASTAQSRADTLIALLQMGAHPAADGQTPS